MLLGDLRGQLFFLYLFQNGSDVDAHRAEPDTSAATGTENVAEFVVVIFELVHDPVTVALGLLVAGIVA